MTSEKIDILLREVADLKIAIKNQTKRYSWEERATESGIQIAGGPTTVTHYGLFRGVAAIPTPQGIAVAFILEDESNGRINVLSTELVKQA